MPVASQIAHAAGSYRFNAGLFEKSVDGLSPDDWHRRPGDCANAMIWVAGHIVWARSRTLFFLGKQWSKPWLQLFARGSMPGEDCAYPLPEEIVSAWHEVKAVLTVTLEETTAEALSVPGPEKLPSFDGMLSGAVSFMAWHETYHVGQTALLHRWLGHGQVAG